MAGMYGEIKSVKNLKSRIDYLYINSMLANCCVLSYPGAYWHGEMSDPAKSGFDC